MGRAGDLASAQLALVEAFAGMVARVIDGIGDTGQVDDQHVEGRIVDPPLRAGRDFALLDFGDELTLRHLSSWRRPSRGALHAAVRALRSYVARARRRRAFRGWLAVRAHRGPSGGPLDRPL